MVLVFICVTSVEFDSSHQIYDAVNIFCDFYVHVFPMYMSFNENDTRSFYENENKGNNLVYTHQSLIRTYARICLGSLPSPTIRTVRKI